MTEHAITIRRSAFPERLSRPAFRPARRRSSAREGGGRLWPAVESSEDTAKLEALEKAGKLKRITFHRPRADEEAVDPSR